MLPIWVQLLIGFFLVSFARAESPKTLWVLQKPDEIAAYELPSFAARRTMKVPRRLLEHPEYLRINSRGQILFHPLHGVEWTGGEMAAAGHLVWFWDGQKAREWKLPWVRKMETSGGKSSLTETKAQSFLSADGESLFWFENRFEKMIGESGTERSVHTSFRVWRTDVSGNNPVGIVQSSIPGRCECGTGFCSETCPEFSFWAPGGVVSDFFLVTRFTPGQIGSTYYETHLYQLSGREWIGKKLARAAENPLDGSEAGELMVMAVPDGACCGSQNDGDDQTLVLRRDTVFVVHDEFKRFGNRNYDVSFYTPEARLAPGNGRLAYALVSTATPGKEIRLSPEGKRNPEELLRIRKAIAELPAVEVWKLEPRLHLEKAILSAGLVGWLSAAEILVAQGGRLIVFDVENGAERATTLRVRGAADALLVR